MTDSFNLPSGQGRVGMELATGLVKRGHDVGYLGWFQMPRISTQSLPGVRFWWTNNNLYGQDALDQVVMEFQPDIVLTVGDFWNLSWITDRSMCRTRHTFQWCSYIPVDGEPLNGGIPPGIRAVIEDIDIPVAYTEYAKAAVLKSIFDQETRNRIRVIYHGVDTSIYKPIDPKERRAIRESMGIGDKFLFLTVSRNQSRKNIPELLRAWKKFSELPGNVGNVALWPHMNFNDPMGWKILDLLEVLQLRNHSIMYYNSVANGSHEMQLLPEAELAKLYQIADAFVLVAGEGFGLPTFEAMATKLPCVLLDHSASAELGKGGRSELVPVTGAFTWTGAHLTQRPIPDPDRIVDALSKVYKDREYREMIAENGFKFATQYTWDKVLDDWNTLFLEHEVPFIKPKTLEVIA